MWPAQSTSLALGGQSPALSDTGLLCDLGQVPFLSEPWLPLLKHQEDGTEHSQVPGVNGKAGDVAETARLGRQTKQLTPLGSGRGMPPCPQTAGMARWQE